MTNQLHAVKRIFFADKKPTENSDRFTNAWLGISELEDHHDITWQREHSLSCCLSLISAQLPLGSQCTVWRVMKSKRHSRNPISCCLHLLLISRVRIETDVFSFALKQDLCFYLTRGPHFVKLVQCSLRTDSLTEKKIIHPLCLIARKWSRLGPNACKKTEIRAPTALWRPYTPL